MQIRTIWQPSYTPAQVEKKTVRIGRPKSEFPNDVLRYLETNGISTTLQMLKDFGTTSSILSLALGKLKKAGLVDFERSGGGSERIVSYWAVSNPPQTSQRCMSYRVLDWFRRNPWAAVKDIPNSLYTEVRQIHSMCLTLEEAGKLVSRKTEGYPKEYQAVTA